MTLLASLRTLIGADRQTELDGRKKMFSEMEALLLKEKPSTKDIERVRALVGLLGLTLANVEAYGALLAELDECRTIGARAEAAAADLDKAGSDFHAVIQRHDAEASAMRERHGVELANAQNRVMAARGANDAALKAANRARELGERWSRIVAGLPEPSPEAVTPEQPRPAPYIGAGMPVFRHDPNAAAVPPFGPPIIHHA